MFCGSQTTCEYIRDTNKAVFPAPTKAEVGQTIIVKSVDSNGKPTEWGAAMLPLMVNFETEDFAALTSTDKTAQEMIEAVQNGCPVIGTVVNRNNQTGMTVLVQWDGRYVQVGCPISDGAWHHEPQDSSYFVDGDVGNRTIGNERWNEY